MSDNTQGSNTAPAREDVFKQIRALGRDQAAGSDSMPKLFMACVEAADNGFLTLDKDSDGKDDFVRVYDEFAKGASKKVYSDRKASSTKAQISKLRLAGKLATYPNCSDSVTLVAEAIKLHTSLAKQGFEVRAPYAALQEIARKQLKTDRDLSDDEIRECVVPAEGVDKSAETELKRAYRILERLITGEGGITDQHSDTVAAHKSIKTRLAAFAQENKVANAWALIAEAEALKVELGLEVAA